MQTSIHGDHEAEHALAPDQPGDRLDRDVGDAEHDSGPRRRASGRGAHAAAPIRGPMIRSIPPATSAPSNAIIPGTEKRESVPWTWGSVTPSRTSPNAVRPQPHPLPAADLQPEHPLGDHRQHHDAACQHRLNDRERGERHRRDMEHPGARGDDHPDREARATCRARSAHRNGSAHVDRGRRAGASMLVEEADVRRESAGERKQDAEKSHKRMQTAGLESKCDGTNVPRWSNLRQCRQLLLIPPRSH